MQTAPWCCAPYWNGSDTNGAWRVAERRRDERDHRVEAEYESVHAHRVRVRAIGQQEGARDELLDGELARARARRPCREAPRHRQTISVASASRIAVRVPFGSCTTLPPNEPILMIAGVARRERPFVLFNWPIPPSPSRGIVRGCSVRCFRSIFIARRTLPSRSQSKLDCFRLGWWVCWLCGCARRRRYPRAIRDQPSCVDGY